MARTSATAAATIQVPRARAPLPQAVPHDADERLRCVVDLSMDYYWEQDERGRFTCVLHGDAHLPENVPAQFLGKTPMEVLDAEPVSQTWAEYQAIVDARQPFRDFVVVRRASVSERYLSVSGRPMFDLLGRFTGYRGIARDVTAQRRSERLMRLEHEITVLLSDTTDPVTALGAAIRAICESEGWDAGQYWALDEEHGVMRPRVAWSVADARIGVAMGQAAELMVPCGAGLVGHAWQSGEPLWVPDLRRDARVIRAQLAEQTGWLSAVLFPVPSNGQIVGVLDFNAVRIPEPDQQLSAVIHALSQQVGRYHERATSLAQLRESEERYASTVELAAIGIAHVAPNGRFIHVNRRMCEMLGYTRDALLGLAVQEVSHPDDVHVTDRDVARLRSGDIASFTAEKRYIRLDGTPIWVRITVASKRGAHGEALHDISVVEDVSDRRRAEERVQYVVTHDDLTHLPNRAMFNQMLAHAVEQGRRYQRRFALLFIDLDRFKVVNDSLGHEAGDELLRVIAARLRDCVRSSDLVARLGGDEFVVLLDGLKDSTAAAPIAREILAAATQSMDILGHECRVTASVGIAAFPDDADDATGLMRNADRAMYQAKERGKNTYHLYSRTTCGPSVRRLAIETCLRHAIDRQELSLHYQPKVDMRTGRLSGAEALLRWQSAELGSMSPAEFIPIAEQCGLIVPIGRWVLRTACAQGATWIGQGLTPVPIATNISPLHFSDPRFLADVDQALTETGVPPTHLELEITESALVHDVEDVASKLRALRAKGVRISVDDFGTGYSSLAHLRRFPINTLKIDRAFVKDLPSDAEGGAIAEAIITLGRTLGITVVAEGVETAEQQAFLSRCGCDEMQGYYFSKPCPADVFADVLRTYVATPRT